MLVILCNISHHVILYLIDPLCKTLNKLQNTDGAYIRYKFILILLNRQSFIILTLYKIRL